MPTFIPDAIRQVWYTDDGKSKIYCNRYKNRYTVGVFGSGLHHGKLTSEQAKEVMQQLKKYRRRYSSRFVEDVKIERIILNTSFGGYRVAKCVHRDASGTLLPKITVAVITHGERTTPPTIAKGYNTLVFDAICYSVAQAEYLAWLRNAISDEDAEHAPHHGVRRILNELTI